MSVNYNVVFECTPQMGGYAGYRYSSVFKDKDEFEKLNPPSPNPTCVAAIAQGITRDKAEDLVAQTPEICLLTSAIHELCDNPEGRISDGLVDISLAKAFVAIEKNRRRRRIRYLKPEVNWQNLVQPGSEDNEQNALYRYVRVHLVNRYGLLGDLKLIKRDVLSKINTLISHR